MTRSMFAIGAALAGCLAVASGHAASQRRSDNAVVLPPDAGSFACHVASITDGDTFRCTETDSAGRQIRVRVSGIDARERDGSCAPGHPCASASAEAATAALTRLISGQALSCRPTGDTYGRVAAFCRRSDGADVSCAMMASGTVARWDRYWGGHRCP